MTDKRLRALTEIAERERLFYLQNRAKVHLEAAIGSLLSVYSVVEVRAILEQNSAHLSQYG